MIELKIPRIVKNWGADKALVPNLAGMRENGYGRRFAVQTEHPMTQKAFAQFGLTTLLPEPSFGIFTGHHYLNGAHTHMHKDPITKQGYAHVRCNVMLKKPLEGGNPVLDGKELEVNKNDLWICFSSMETHGSVPIKGGERLIISFGALVPQQDVNNIIKNR
jgi:hypothetical protein